MLSEVYGIKFYSIKSERLSSADCQTDKQMTMSV